MVAGTFQAGSTEAALERLRASDVPLSSAIDVGACVGEWSAAFLRVYPELQTRMFEAQDDLSEDLARFSRLHAGADFEICALGSEEGTKTFYVARDDRNSQGSSLYRENSNVPVIEEPVAVVTLDCYDEFLGPSPYLLKIDVQGAELDVLSGAESNVLPVTNVIWLESSLMEYNLGAPDIVDVMLRMGELGFRLHDIPTLHRRSQDSRLIQADLIFLRRALSAAGDSLTVFPWFEG